VVSASGEAGLAYDEYGIRFLFHAADLGVDFSDPATLGHQFLFADPTNLANALAACRAETSATVATDIYCDCKGYVDGVLRFLGAGQVDSIDASEFEDATVVHDLNDPIPPELEERYSVVIDGGTLEHVFDFPMAIRNAMRMVRIGGHLILNVPVNNFPGHGFYQISPELVFRAVSPRFGYHILDAVLMELYHPRHHWYRVFDPAAVGHRVMFRSHSRTLMFVVAQRTGSVPEFSPPPSQSDYVTEWDRVGSTEPEIDVTRVPVGAGVATSAAGASSSSTTALADRARNLALRHLPDPLVRSFSEARRSVPARLGRSRPYRLLREWTVWAFPRVGVHPHYTKARPGFQRVHEPWTASIQRPRVVLDAGAEAPSPMYGQP
jgi:SAM-dependent methyltransferase